MAESTSLELGVRELARLLNSHPSSVQRTLESAHEAGLVAPSPRGLWQLGWDFFRIASLAQNKTPYAGAQPELDRLRDLSDETAVLTVYDARLGQRMFVCSSASHQSVRFVPDLLVWMPMHLGATATAILAYRPSEEQARVLGSTGATAARLKEIELRLREIAQVGHAISIDEIEVSASAVAVPVRGAGGVTASLGIIAPSSRFASLDTNVLAMELALAAEQLSTPT